MKATSNYLFAFDSQKGFLKYKLDLEDYGRLILIALNKNYERDRE